MNTNRLVRIVIPVLVFLGMIYVVGHGNSRQEGGEGHEISYSRFVNAINVNEVLDGSFAGRDFRGHFTRNNEAFTVYLPPEDSQEYTLLVERLLSHGVKTVAFIRPQISDSMTGLIVSVLLPLVVIFFFWMFFLR